MLEVWRRITITRVELGSLVKGVLGLTPPPVSLTVAPPTRVTEEESTATTMEALKARIRELERQIQRGDRYKCLICMVSIRTAAHTPSMAGGGSNQRGGTSELEACGTPMDSIGWSRLCCWPFICQNLLC